TVRRLRAHRKQQRELLMKNRTTYQDHDLVFAKEHDDVQTPRAQLGQPAWGLVERHFRRLMKAAGVAITPHGCRHTTATLALAATVPVQVVAQRLGHSRATQTLDVYAHALPDMQHDATAKLGAVLAGN
ncbi:MAG: tyrosine-type recombinase/integrase, partial [Vicinamibacterales bacterium]